MTDWPTPEEGEAMFLALLERLEQGLEDSDIRELDDPMDGPIPMDSAEVEQAFRDGDIEAMYRGLNIRDGQLWLNRLSRSMDASRNGRKGVEAKMKDVADVHKDWRDHARQYFIEYPDAPIKDAVEDIYRSEVQIWEDITGGHWERTQELLKNGELNYSKAFGKLPKPRKRSTIWAVVAYLAPKNQD